MDREELLARARVAARRAYAPYSGFRVGAAVAVAGLDGEHIVTGANVENASYGLTLCAERAALATALTSAPLAETTEAIAPGERVARRPRITAVAVACIDAPPGAPVRLRTPCGACRQWLAELAPDATYYVDGVPGALHLDDLLPLAFRMDEGAQ